MIKAFQKSVVLGKEETIWGDLGIDGRLILKVILRERDVKEMEWIKLL